MSWRSWYNQHRGPLGPDTPTGSDASSDACHDSGFRGQTLSADSADAVEFNTLVQRHAREMLAVAAAIVGQADGEDATQEAIVRAWQAWPTLRDRDALRPWLLQVTVNVCRDWLRGRFGTHRRLREPLDEGEDASAVEALVASDPGDSDHATALDLRLAIGTLPDDLRLVVALRYYAGFDATEIGNALKIPSATVRTRLRHALMLLRERLREQSRSNQSGSNQSGAIGSSVTPPVRGG